MNCGGGVKDGQASGRCLSVSCLNTRCCWPAVNWITHMNTTKKHAPLTQSAFGQLHSPGTAW